MVNELWHNIAFRGDRRPRWARAGARMLSGAASLPVTTAYAVILLAVSAILTELGPHTREHVVSQMSTNVDNLEHGHLDTLVGSAFVDAGGHIYLWLPGLVSLLALGELAWRSPGLITVFAVGHIGATLIVAAGLLAAIKEKWLPISIAHATDVGMSYGAVCVLGALTSTIPRRWRRAWTGTWLGIAAAATLGGDFTAFGHILGLLLGIALSPRMRATRRWTTIHTALLAVGVPFAYFMLCGWSTMAPIAALTGPLTSTLARRLGRTPDATGSHATWRARFRRQCS